MGQMPAGLREGRLWGASGGGLSGKMKGLGAALVLAGGPLAAMELPSGLEAVLFEVRSDEVSGAAWLRFRFVAPGLDAAAGFETALEDMQFLCDAVALPHLAETGAAPEIIVISLSDREVVFGEVDPAAVQFFESYRAENGVCIWEVF